MVLIDTYRKIGRREVLDCRIKSLKEWVRHYGLHLHSYEVLLFSEALTFQYNKIRIPGISVGSLPYATASHSGTEAAFCRNLNITCRKEQIGGDEQGWAQMKTLIDQNIPVLFRIDSRFLKGTEDAAPRQLKLNLYYLSTLLLVGYDEMKGLAYVVLTNDDERATVNEISIDEFQTYRCSVCAPFSPEGTSFYLEPGRVPEPARKDALRDTLLGCLLRTADTMLNNGELYRMDLGSFTGTEVRKGICGMERMKADLEELLMVCEGEAESLMSRLIMVFLRNNLMFGSYSAFREEFGLSIKYLADQYNVLPLAEIGRAFVGISQMWKELFVQLSAIAHSRGVLADQLRHVILMWDRIIRSEKEQYGALRSVLGSGFLQTQSQR